MNQTMLLVMIIVALVSFIFGLVVGVILTQPRIIRYE